MPLNPLNNSNLEQLASKGLTVTNSSCDVLFRSLDTSEISHRPWPQCEDASRIRQDAYICQPGPTIMLYYPKWKILSSNLVYPVVDCVEERSLALRFQMPTRWQLTSSHWSIDLKGYNVRETVCSFWEKNICMSILFIALTFSFYFKSFVGRI